MGQFFFWEANSSSPSQEILRILSKPNVRYHVHNNTSLVSVLSQINPVHTPHSLSWRSILISFSLLRLNLQSFLLTNVTFLSLSPICGTCSAHVILLDVITQIIFGEVYISWSSSSTFHEAPHHSVFYTPCYPRCLIPDIFLVTQTSSNHIEFNKWKTLGNTAVLCVLFPQ